MQCVLRSITSYFFLLVAALQLALQCSSAAVIVISIGRAELMVRSSSGVAAAAGKLNSGLLTILLAGWLCAHWASGE